MKPRPKSSRRDFLIGHAALDALADLPDRLPAEPAKANDRPTYLIQIARDAMACQFQVLLNAKQESGGTEAALAALDRVEQIEDQLTVYRASSEVSRLNSRGAAQPVAVDGELCRLLQTSLELFHETGGAFDITAGPLSQVWGFHRREGKLPSSDAIRDALELVGSQWIELDAKASSVRFARPGLTINFGGIGKGHALDEAARIMTNDGVEDFLFHGGHSSLIARGTRRGRSGEMGWRVAVRHPLRHEVRLAEVCLRDRALGTSGSGNQFFHFAGQRYGHVLDPRTGYPADGVLSATVLAPTATLADALATAFFVMGVEAAREFCLERPELGAILISAGAEAGSLSVHTWGLADDEWKEIE